MTTHSSAPPQRPAAPPFNGDPGAAAWVSALAQYLPLRHALVDPREPAAVLEWLRLQFLREQIPEGRRDRRRRPDAFGLQRPVQAQLLDWPARLKTPGGQPLGVARVEATGREALTLALSFNLHGDQPYQLELATGSDRLSTLSLWPLWQSKTQINRWRVGAVVLRLEND